MSMRQHSLLALCLDVLELSTTTRLLGTSLEDKRKLYEHKAYIATPECVKDFVDA